MADPVSIAITVAVNAAAMALTAMRKIEGPRLSDLKATTADYGTPVMQFYGTKRLECPCFYAEDIREVKQKNKTKGGKYTEYKYYGTWAVLIADCPTGPLDEVLKIWLDRHLVFDRTKRFGPISIITALTFGVKLNTNLRIYLGTEDQEPDRRMLAKIEDAEGPGTCPAYLGVAYLMFEEVPLEKFGNHLPQVSVQATRNGTPAYPYELKTSSQGASDFDFAFSPGGLWMVTARNSSGGLLEWWDAPSRTRIGFSPSNPGFATSSFSNTSLAYDGTAYQYGTILVPTHSYLATTPPLGSPTLELIDGPNIFDRCVVLENDTDTKAYGTYSGFFAGYFEDAVLIAHSQKGESFCVDGDGNFWGLFIPASSSNQFTIERVAVLVLGPGESGTFTADVTRSSAGSALICYVDNSDHFFCWLDGHFYIIDRATMTLKSKGTLNGRPFIPEQSANMSSVWSVSGGTFYEYSLVDGSLLYSAPQSNWYSHTEAGAYAFDPGNLAIWDIQTSSYNGTLIVRYLQRADGGGWTLGEICGDVAVQAGMLESEFNFVDLDQEVLGYSWSQGPAKDIVGPLLDLFDSDVRPHGFIQQGLKRGRALDADAISSEWMVPDSSSDDSSPLYRVPMTAETDLPLRLFGTFADPTAEEQPNTAIAQRNSSSVETTREATFDLTTLSMAPDDMQPLLERALRRFWIGSTKPEFNLSPLEIRLEPGDVRHVLIDGERMRCRNTRATIKANRVVETEWEVDGEVQFNPPAWDLDDASPLSTLFPAPGGVTNGRPPEDLLIPVRTKGFVLDTPLFTDADDQTSPFVYVTAGPYTEGTWFGAIVWSADLLETDTEFDPGFDNFTSDEAMTWGFAQDALPNHSTAVLDYGSEIGVLLPAGDLLSSSTEDAILLDPALNLALIGDELVQFITATQVDATSWTLSGFVRGARGTEWATGTHAAGDRFVLISDDIHKRSMGASEIGDTDYYKFTTPGDDPDATETQTLAFGAAAHRPYSPSHLTLTRNTGTGDWTISWIRRTRIGGSTLNGQDVPLGETSELYRVKIMDGADVLASYDVTSESKLYTAAEQTADWGSTQSSLSVEVVQVSPVLNLEGFTSAASA